MKKFYSLIATLLVLAIALWIGRTLWVDYMETPWTRDGRVRADIINVRRCVRHGGGSASA